MSGSSQLPPGADGVDDPSIPLLTDRIYLPAVDLDTALPVPAAGRAPATATGEPATGLDRAPAPQAAVATGPHPGAADEGDEAAPPAHAEASIETELDRDLLTASDADFEALLSAEQQLAAAAGALEPAGSEAAQDVPPADGGGLAGATLAAPGATGPTTTVPPAEPSAGPPVEPADGPALEAQAEALRTAVLQRVASGLPERVDATLRELMQPAIEQAMARLGEEAEVALRITLQELVEQALRDEMADRRGPRRS